MIEQPKAFGKSRTDGVNTIWYVDHKYDFETFFTSGYAPLTFRAYSRPLSEMEVSYLGIDNEIASELLAKVNFT